MIVYLHVMFREMQKKKKKKKKKLATVLAKELGAT